MKNARITPAYAGKRVSFLNLLFWMPDHPRLRGEKYWSGECCPDWFGSPPLTRGKVLSALFGVLSARITPAYAGKSALCTFWGAFSKDHPRLRGEKPVFFLLMPRLLGSPPLTRGKGLRSHGKNQRNGITPAYAGKRLNTVAKRSHIICSYPVFYCISFDILPPPFNCSYSLLVISQSFSARCGFIFCQPKYLASVVSW